MKRLRALLKKIFSDNISFLAGGVAFYGLFALFPALAAMVSIFGLAANPYIVRDQIEAMRRFFPPQVYNLLHDQVLMLLNEPNTTLSVTAIVAFFIAIYSATKGTQALLAALNSVYRVAETRSWVLQHVVAFFITLGAMIMLIAALFAIVAIPVLLNLLPLGTALSIQKPLQYTSWGILAVASWGGMTLLFLIGPNKPLRDQHLHAVAIGAAAATILWLIGALIGSWLIQLIPNFNAAYGSLSAVSVLMLFMLGSAYTILIGAGITDVLNSRSQDTEEANKKGPSEEGPKV